MGKTSSSNYQQVHVQEQCDTWLSATMAAKHVPAKKKIAERKTPSRRVLRTPVNPALLDISWSSQPLEIKATKQASIKNFLQKKPPSIVKSTSYNKDVCIEYIEPSSENLVMAARAKVEGSSFSLQSEALHQFDDYYYKSPTPTLTCTSSSEDRLVSGNVNTQITKASCSSISSSLNMLKDKNITKEPVCLRKKWSNTTHEDNLSCDSCSTASEKTVASSLDLFPDISDDNSTDSCDKTLIDFPSLDTKQFAVKSDTLNLYQNMQFQMPHASKDLQLSIQAPRYYNNQESFSGCTGSSFHTTLGFSECTELSQSVIPPTLPRHRKRKCLSSDQRRESWLHESSNLSLPSLQISQNFFAEKPAETLLLFSPEKKLSFGNISGSTPRSTCTDDESVYCTARSQETLSMKSDAFNSVMSLEGSASETYKTQGHQKHFQPETLTLGLSRDQFLRDSTNCDIHTPTESESSDTDLFGTLTFHSPTSRKHVP